METLTDGDRKFLNGAMRYFNIRKLRIVWSNYNKTKHPDIWCLGNKIVVTAEWRRQSATERRKRLTHELLHFKGLKHGKYGKYVYSTYPKLDTYSVKVYRDLIKVMG